MKGCALVSAVLFVAFAVANAVDQQELLERLKKCIKATNWSHERYNEVCLNGMPDTEPDKSTFLYFNTCVWVSSELIDPSTGKVTPENIKNLVTPAEAAASIALVSKCNPSDDSLTVVERANAIQTCYRSDNKEKYAKDCTRLGDMLL